MSEEKRALRALKLRALPAEFLISFKDSPS